MLRRTLRCTVVATVLAAVAGSAASAQVTIGTPGAAGNGTNYPFGHSGGWTKFQQLYSSSLFAEQLNIGSVSFFTKPNTGILQQGTFNFFFSTTSVAAVNVNTSTPSANVTGPRQAFGTLTIAANTAAPSVLTVTGSPFLYDPLQGNLLLEVDFTAIGGGFAIPARAVFDLYRDAQGEFLVSTASDRQFGVLASNGIRGQGLVTRFDEASVVPEPAAFMLLASGFLGLAMVARRRRTVASPASPIISMPTDCGSGTTFTYSAK